MKFNIDKKTEADPIFFDFCDNLLYFKLILFIVVSIAEFIDSIISILNNEVKSNIYSILLLPIKKINGINIMNVNNSCLKDNSFLYSSFIPMKEYIIDFFIFFKFSIFTFIIIYFIIFFIFFIKIFYSFSPNINSNICSKLINILNMFKYKPIVAIT